MAKRAKGTTKHLIAKGSPWNLPLFEKHYVYLSSGRTLTVKIRDQVGHFVSTFGLDATWVPEK